MNPKNFASENPQPRLICPALDSVDRPQAQKHHLFGANDEQKSQLHSFHCQRDNDRGIGALVASWEVASVYSDGLFGQALRKAKASLLETIKRKTTQLFVQKGL
ncbi:Hypothetical predicted protein [Cloeon dipterum]|uniref:Uncharacterized protein n=1 Tax=Cloeon dipterum TaxID=197152 RepID=A0A8S1CP64_9INSE|nr:Hypothetical predicted protein [Cloeon dipterum]